MRSNGRLRRARGRSWWFIPTINRPPDRRGERERLEALCARWLALIVDEVFLDYPLREVTPPPQSFACGAHPVLTFVLSGLSKIAGLPQMKAAWIAALGPERERRGAGAAGDCG